MPTSKSLSRTAIVKAKGMEVLVEAGKSYWWCACGLSKKQPFCDGSHNNTSFAPVRYQAVETGSKLFCVCKQTRNAPLCDGISDPCTVVTQVTL
jgi:CDGSH iron-sulfur domain-containing protein 3